jgi:hypothetical protein
VAAGLGGGALIGGRVTAGLAVGGGIRGGESTGRTGVVIGGLTGLLGTGASRGICDATMGGDSTMGGDATTLGAAADWNEDGDAAGFGPDRSSGTTNTATTMSTVAPIIRSCS